MKLRRFSAAAAMVVIAFAAAQRASAEQPLARLYGADFIGGANQRFGSIHHGQGRVNYVYAQPTGSCAAMRATFEIERLPQQPMFLHVKALDDDFPDQCDIELTLNGKAIISGPNGFDDKGWKVSRFPIPPGLLKAGVNEIVVTNVEKTGRLGMPPWFMLAWCVIAGEDYVPTRDITKDFFIELPERKRPLPEPLAGGQAPGFRIRGIKGWNWTAKQYLEEIPILAKHKMNFLMNCYTSMYSHHPQFRNEWELPIPAEKKRAYEEVIRSCQKNGIDYCFALHPQLHSPRPLDPTSDDDFEKFWPHFAWAQSLGVKWFCVSLDDVGGLRIDGAEHARFVNKLFQRLREKDADAQFILCPTQYWGDGASPRQRRYLEPLGRELHKDVYLFWTGDGVVTPRITRRAAESYKGIVKHRLILWDNYPVNDNNPTLHLGPVTGRDPDLCEVIDGYMSNPLCPQNQINRIPLLTCADYAYNPEAYDPARSIGQAILHLAKTDEQRATLKDLVEAYPGMLLCGGGTAMNPVRRWFERLSSERHSRYIAEIYVRHLEKLSARLDRAFPRQYASAKRTLANDVAWMREALAANYKE